MSSALAKRIKHGRYVVESDQRADEDLIAVGYACTIFRDDEKADFINEERHLMGHPSDNSVTMDRYDARLHLHDLDLYDAIKTSRGNGVEKEETKYTDADESELEFERYRDLMAADDSEEANYGSNFSSAVEHASDSSANDSRTSSPFVDENSKDGRSRRKEQPFVPPSELELPSGLQAPETMQLHTIIAKTASFVATKGAQMEIVIKAKQKTKDNHFGFLEFDDPLRPYYDHVLGMIKRGRYHFVEPEQEESEDDDEGGDYLHPSLMISASSSTSLSGMAKEKKTEEEEKTEKANQEEQPSVDLQPIMDRLAEYVARNGDTFEDVVRTRKDPLYAFIEPKHEFHNYYRQRVLHYRSQYNRAERTVQSILQRSHRSLTSSPALMSSKYEKPERRSRKYSPRPSSKSSRRHRSRSRSRSRSDERRERRRERRKSDRERDGKKARRSRSPSDDDEDAKKRKAGIKFATFVPVPVSEGEKSVSPAPESSPVPDNVVKKSLGVDEEEKKTDETVKKIQEERRAKAKIFLRLMKDRDQTASKIVNAGQKPWEDE